PDPAPGTSGTNRTRTRHYRAAARASGTWGTMACMSESTSTHGSSPVRAGAEPFSAPGGPVGVLLCHGFTGSPASMVPWGRRLAEQGHTVTVPLLPGHGTTWQEMNT